MSCAEQPIKDAVITVPAFFNQAERRAVLQAARMAGLKVLQLINDNTATALSYGVFRRKDINSTAQVGQEELEPDVRVASSEGEGCWVPGVPQELWPFGISVAPESRQAPTREPGAAPVTAALLSLQNVMFYDMGSGSTVCTIVTYQTVKTKEAGVQPQLQVRGVG